MLRAPSQLLSFLTSDSRLTHIASTFSQSNFNSTVVYEHLLNCFGVTFRGCRFYPPHTFIIKQADTITGIFSCSKLEGDDQVFL